MNEHENDNLRRELHHFFGDGFFAWQFSSEGEKRDWEERRFNEAKYWGGFSTQPINPADDVLPAWAIGPFEKYAGNPIFAPDPQGWDCGHFGGGVHNGSVLKKDGLLYYIYRGEFPIPDEPRFKSRRKAGFSYLCDVGVAVSEDGIHFKRIAGPVLRRPEDWMVSFEDNNCVEYNGRYYLFLNRWDWGTFNDSGPMWHLPGCVRRSDPLGTPGAGFPTAPGASTAMRWWSRTHTTGRCGMKRGDL